MAGLKNAESITREYSVADLARLREMMLKAENFGEPFLETELLHLKKNTELSLSRPFVAVVEDQVVGFTSLGRRTFALNIDSTIVDQRHQREGIGGRLVEKAKEYAKSQGLDVLRTSTGAFMDYAIKLCLACGFEPCGYVEHGFSLGSKQLHFHIDLTKKEGERST
jgi:GNAT superfamily N-acetyltransferase